VMDQRYLKSRLLYAPRTGVFYWVAPPPEHSELLGEEAGTVQDGAKPYHVIQVDGIKYNRARLAYLFMTGDLPDALVDHINGNSLDDRWLNLRAATVMQNAWNHKGRKKRSPLPMGVRMAASGRFCARIGVSNSQIQIGTFDTAEEAAEAYRQARGKYFGHFA